MSQRHSGGTKVKYPSDFFYTIKLKIICQILSSGQLAYTPLNNQLKAAV